MPPNLQAQAAQAAAQGQQMLNQDQSQAAASKAQYGTYQGQADAANQAVKSYTQGMQSAYDANTGNGNAGSAYNYSLNQQLGKLGYDPQQMAAAQTNLNQATGALSAYSDFANQAASKFGLNAGGFAAANSGALSSLNNNIAANQGVVNGLNTKYGMAQTGANQFAGVTVQGEHETLAGLQDVYNNASNARDQAANMMQFYNDLAQKQGGLNAQQQQYYGQAVQAYASATAARAQAGLYARQAALAQQQYDQQAKLFADQQAQQTGGNININGQSVYDPHYNAKLGADVQ